MRLALARRCGFVALLVGVGSFAVSGLAAQAPADKAALIRRLLALTQAANLAVTAMEASIPAQRAANPRIPKELTKVQPEVTVQSAQAGQKWGAELGAAVAQDLAKRGVKMPEQ